MGDSRKRNTKRNIVFSLCETFLTLGFQFVSRSIIISVFNSEYLGLSSLFASILKVLSMAELGFSSAIVFNMYKPIAEHDIDTVCSLLSFYRKVYRIVGLVVLGIGVVIIPIIPKLINGELPEGINIYIVYAFYLANTVVSYFLFAYKSALLDALQRIDLTKIAYTVISIAQYVLQIVCILVLKNYYLFMLGTLIGTAFKNIFCAYISKKLFPEYECRGSISQDVKKNIVLRVKGLFICNISGVTYTTFDSIILSTFLGLSTVAIYNNYIVIFNGVLSFIVLIRSAMQASVGNSIAVETKEKNYNDMLLWQFMFSVIACCCVTCMLSVYQPFMKLWMGEENLLPLRDVILICLWLFISIIPHAFYLYLSGNGLWWEMKYPYIFSTICNLVLNIVLGNIFGTTGIILSTVLASLIFGIVWQCIILFKHYYTDMSIKEYFLKQILFLITCMASCAVAFSVNSLIPIDGVWGIIVRTIISIGCSGIIVWVVYRKTKIYSRAKTFMISVFKL